MSVYAIHNSLQLFNGAVSQNVGIFGLGLREKGVLKKLSGGATIGGVVVKALAEEIAVLITPRAWEG